MIIENRNLGITSEDVEQCNDLKELQRWLRTVENDILSMDLQLHLAETKEMLGEEVDIGWKRKTEAAKMLQERLKKWIEYRILEVSPLEEYIISLVKAYFSLDQWNALVEQAKEAYNEDRNNKRGKDI